MTRIFIASTIPGVVREAVGRAMHPLRDKLPEASWTKTETYHLTYAFLGDQEESRLPPVYEALEGRLAGTNGIAARFADAGFFPSMARPRVGWIALEPAELISSIAVEVRAALEECGVAFEAKPFTPHLTLVRPRTRWRARDCDRFAAATADIASREFRIESVSVFSSKLSPNGARHDELRRIPFTSEIGGQ
ncbi:MAG TPA: RNA 2',3'-cyclic phosphodiesterase [Thermoanaerobaculia bacterium]|nr:RNA 2',3'-cyclic phosphodiesterase [Thermoanaerobaculia bacterium]